jgi:hypothetical protein
MIEIAPERHRVAPAFWVALLLGTIAMLAGALRSADSSERIGPSDVQLLINVFREHIADLKWTIAGGGTAMAAAIGLLFSMLMKSQKTTKSFRGDLTAKVGELERRFLQHDLRAETAEKRNDRIEQLIQVLDGDLKKLNDRLDTMARELAR